MARPIIATEVGGLPEIIKHQRTGLLVEKENSIALTDAITFLLDNITTASRMGQEARSRTQQEFSWDGCVDAYDTHYRKLIMDWRPSPNLSKLPKTTNLVGA